MCASRGRVRLPLSLCLCLVPLLAFASSLLADTSSPVAAPGREATAAEVAALDEAVDALVQALLRKDVAGLARRIAAGKASAMAAEDWSRLLHEAGELRQLSREEQLFDILSDPSLRVAEVQTWGARGVCRLVVTIRPDVWLPLVRQAGQWLLDASAWEQARAARDLAAQEQTLNQEDMLPLMMLFFPSGDSRLPRDLLALALNAPQQPRYAVTDHRIVGEGAQVRVQGEVQAQFAAPLQRDRAGWHIASRPTFVLMQPDQPLTRSLAQDRSGGVSATCRSNLQCLAMAILKYAKERGKFPPADRWGGSIYPGYLPNERVFRCPAADLNGYAMNYRLSRLDPKQVTQPESTVLLFDTRLPQANAYDQGTPPGASVTVPPRHDDVINYVFADGRAASFREPLPAEFFRPVRSQQQLLKLPPATSPGGG